MSGVNPRTIKGQVWWDKTRRAAYEKNNWHCWACGVHSSQARFASYLEAHEVYDIDYIKGTMKLKEVVALCHSCHNFIHIGRLYKLLMNGEVSPTDFMAIANHGYAILSQANLVPWWTTRVLLEPGYRVTGLEEGATCRVAWGDWRLIIGRKKHPPFFKTEAEWNAHYNP